MLIAQPRPWPRFAVSPPSKFPRNTTPRGVPRARVPSCQIIARPRGPRETSSSLSLTFSLSLDHRTNPSLACYPQSRSTLRAAYPVVATRTKTAIILLDSYLETLVASWRAYLFARRLRHPAIRLCTYTRVYFFGEREATYTARPCSRSREGERSEG